MKDLGYLSYFLGLEITHSTDGLYITQAKYAFELLSRAGLNGIQKLVKKKKKNYEFLVSNFFK